MKRTLSGIRPTSETQLGNYLGAMRRWSDQQHEADTHYFLADLHSLSDTDSTGLAERTIKMANTLMAVGLDPQVCTIFVQSHVPEHTGLTWLLECTVSFGELRRMTQFKDKGGDNEGVSAGLLTYPALMAADILLYDADEVPVGEDQRQHVELARDIAGRFNNRHGETFKIPKPTFTKSAARVRDLQDPTKKMSKSLGGQGTVWLLDDPKVIEKKIKRAVTDTESEVRLDWENKPGVSNLLEILSACTGDPIDELVKRYSQYGPLKSDTAAAVVETLRPVQERYEELEADPATTLGVLAAGAQSAREIAATTLERAQSNIGLLMASSDF